MNKLVKPLACLLLATAALSASTFPLRVWLDRRFNPAAVDVKPIQGLQERIVSGNNGGGKLNLRLKEFLELVLKNSTDVNLARLDVYTAEDQVIAANAPWDPSLALGFQTQRSVSPQFTQIGGAPTLSTLNQTSTINYQQVLPTGQTVMTNFTAARTSSNSAFDFFNPNIFSALNFQVMQPLLRDRNNIELRAPQQIARTQVVITSRQSEATIANVLAQAAGQYWDAVRDRDDIKVQELNLGLAQKSYDRDKQALDLGALASLDIYQSETQVASRKRDLIQSQFVYKGALDGLRRLIGADLTPELRAVEIVLLDDPSVLPSKASILPFEEALAAALRTRPEMDAAQRRLAVDDLNARVARNLLQPRLDLTAQWSTSGLAGNTVPSVGLLGVPVPGTTGGLGDTLSQVFGFTYPSYGAGLQFTIPFRNSSASAQLSDALVNRTRDRYNERQVQQQITFDVRQALNSLDLAEASIEASVRARDLAVKNSEAEQQKYELGTITAFEVLDAQSRLAAAESALLNTQIGYQEAYVNYQRATWTLLDGLGMVLDRPHP